MLRHFDHENVSVQSSVDEVLDVLLVMKRVA